MSNPLPEPVAYIVHQRVDVGVGMTTDACLRWDLAQTCEDEEYEELHTADQMREFAAAVVAAARDCRSCKHHRELPYAAVYCEGGNDSEDGWDAPCVNADRYEPLPPVRLWRTA